MTIGLPYPESDENKENEENFLLLSDIRPLFVESNPDNKEIRRGIFYSFSDKMKKSFSG